MADDNKTVAQQQAVVNAQQQTLTTVNNAAPVQMQPPATSEILKADQEAKAKADANKLKAEQEAKAKADQQAKVLAQTKNVTPSPLKTNTATPTGPTNPHKGELVNFKQFRGQDRVSVSILVTVQNPGKNGIVEMHGDYLSDNGYVCVQLGAMAFYPKDLPETTGLIPLDAFIKNNIAVNEVYISFRDCDGNQVHASKVKVEATKY